MSVWTPEAINRFTEQAEDIFCQEYRCVIDRIALDIVAGTDLYSVPDNCLDIRRITYRGLKLYPLSHRNDRDFFRPYTSRAEPRWYIYNNLGKGVIKLFPVPVETITANQSNLFDPTAIAGQCIIEFYPVPDGISIKLPEYVRRRLLKAFVLKQCFSVEGKGQNLKASAYWSQKWDYLKKVYGEQLEELILSARKIMDPAIEITRFVPPTAQLPISKQGIGLDPGD